MIWFFDILFGTSYKILWVSWCYFNNFIICMFFLIISKFLIVLDIVFTNLFVTNLNYLKKIIFHNKKWGYWNILNFFIICIDTFWFIYVILLLNMMFNKIFFIFSNLYSLCNDPIFVFEIYTCRFLLSPFYMKNNLWLCSFDMWKFAQ